MKINYTLLRYAKLHNEEAMENNFKLDEGNKNVFTAGFAEKYHLKPVSSTQRSIQKLCKESILTKHSDTYLFNDPFFRLWLIHKMS